MENNSSTVKKHKGGNMEMSTIDSLQVLGKVSVITTSKLKPLTREKKILRHFITIKMKWNTSDFLRLMGTMCVCASVHVRVCECAQACSCWPCFDQRPEQVVHLTSRLHASWQGMWWRMLTASKIMGHTHIVSLSLVNARACTHTYTRTHTQ